MKSRDLGMCTKLVPLRRTDPIGSGEAKAIALASCNADTQ